MTLEFRSVEAEELSEFLNVDAGAFGIAFPSRAVDEVRSGLELDRSYAAFDGGRMVASSSTFTLQMALPGGELVPVGGLSWVGVLPTHRRRGVLRRLVEWHQRDCIERGEVASALGASEATIYGRFGYGIASFKAAYEVDRVRASFRMPVEEAGTFELLDRDEALELLPRVHERVHPTIPGEVSRSSGIWSVYLADLDWEVQDDKPWFYVLHRDADGEPDGYALYRFAEHRWDDDLADHRLEVQEIQGVHPGVRTAVWRYLLDLDLVGSLRYTHAPVDEPIRWALEDPRRLRTTSVSDELWLRPLDVPALLAERRYDRHGGLVLEVVDDLAGGRFHLEVTPDGVACEPTSEDPGVTLGPSELGSVVLGGVSLADLHHAGRVDEHRAGAVDAADALFRTRKQPFTATPF